MLMSIAFDALQAAMAGELLHRLQRHDQVNGVAALTTLLRSAVVRAVNQKRHVPNNKTLAG